MYNELNKEKSLLYNGMSYSQLKETPFKILRRHVPSVQ
uniref:Uncharacterized protein n=1 Tax=Anguilla anguilla TaxID=7936 RepID=A0A0E9W9U1_ANGAN